MPIQATVGGFVSLPMAVWRADRARTSQAELTVEKGVSGNETAMGVKEVRPEYGRKGRPVA